MSQPPQAPYQYYAPPPSAPPKKGAGLAIASMVLGIIALLLSWVPIINNLAAVLAVVGLGLGIPAFLRARKGTHEGHGFSIAGLVTSLVALVLVIATQAFYTDVLDEVERELDREFGSSSSPSSPGDEEQAPEASDEAPDDVVPLGTPAQVGDYEVTVDAVQLDADAVIAEANQFNDPPTGQYVLATLTVTYEGSDEGFPGMDLTAIFHGSDARQYSDSDCSAVTPDDAMDSPTLNPGGGDTFEFCMDVAPEGLEGGRLSIEPTFSWESEERVFFAID